MRIHVNINSFFFVVIVDVILHQLTFHILIFFFCHYFPSQFQLSFMYQSFLQCFAFYFWLKNGQ